MTGRGGQAALCPPYACFRMRCCHSRFAAVAIDPRLPSCSVMAERTDNERGGIMSALAFSRAVSILVGSLGIAAALVGEAASQGSPSRPLVSEAQFEAWKTQ